MSKVDVRELNNALPQSKFALFAGLGFDERCLTVLQNIDPTKCQKIYGLANVQRTSIPFKYSPDDFKSILGKELPILGRNSSSIIHLIDEVQTHIQLVAKDNLEIVIDITSLSHELLVALIGLLASENVLHKVTLLYNGATEYSYNLPKEEMWLSRGVTDIRSVLGFPGLMLPSKKLHLIIMAGFEVERATETISRFEPYRVTIGLGGKNISISEKHYEANHEFGMRLTKFVEEQDAMIDDLQKFEFSCIDPLETANSIIEHVQKYLSDNTVICPLNTKLSTVGAALAALALPRIQICYAQAAEYNTAGYAKPSEEVTVVPLAEICLKQNC